METLLNEAAKKIGINLSDEKIKKFMLYKKLLKEWNEKINLTAITDDREIIIKHFIDSLTIEKYIPKNSSLIDVGTGAGFPGIPIKILRDDVKLVLLDSLNKRINFLNEVIDKCKLDGTKTIHSRAEDAGQSNEYREKFDIATARAVANIATLTELCTPFVKVGGSFICMKSKAKEEMEDAKKAEKVLNIKIENVDEFKIEDIDAERTIIVYKKENHTPQQYPRKAGMPAKSPIK